MDSRELKIKETWAPISSRSDEYLKNIAKDIFNNKIFTDRHCSDNDVMKSFMILALMGPKTPQKPKRPNDSNSTENRRDNAIYYILQYDEDMKKWEEDMKWFKIEERYYREQYLTSIGMVYEYFDKSVPVSINRLPCFFSGRFLNIEDTKKVWDFYYKYKEIREEADNF